MGYDDQKIRGSGKSLRDSAKGGTDDLAVKIGAGASRPAFRENVLRVLRPAAKKIDYRAQEMQE